VDVLIGGQPPRKEINQGCEVYKGIAPPPPQRKISCVSLCISKRPT